MTGAGKKRITWNIIPIPIPRYPIYETPQPLQRKVKNETKQ